MTSIFHEAMRLACNEATVSRDPSTQNGAVLANLNGSAFSKTLSCNQFPDGEKETDERWERPLKYSFIEHAERSAIYAAAVHGIATEGIVLVCLLWAACADCARAIVKSKISKLVTLPRISDITNDRWAESCIIGDTIMSESGVEIEFFADQLQVPQLRRDGKMISL